nr:hypothetical protein [Tanacetum cinerariifolium]
NCQSKIDGSYTKKMTYILPMILAVTFSTPPTPIATSTPTTTVVAALRLSAAAKDEGTGSRPGVLDVPSDDSEEELSWNSSNDKDLDEQTKGREESEGDKTDESDDGSDDDNDKTVKAGSKRDEDDDDNDDEEELAKNDDEDTESGNDEEDQDLRLSEEARIQEEEEADELYRDVDINQGRGLQVTQNIEDSHVTLTSVHPDGEVKSQVKEQVSRILPRIKESVNATLEVDVLTRSSHSSRTSYAIAADLSEMELKKILIEKMKGNKSIQRSDEQRNLYKGGASSCKYSTSVTKTKAVDYGHIKWVEDLVPCVMWIQEPINYDRHALWGVSHWVRKHKQFYGFAVNRESALDLYSKRRIIAVTELKIVEWHNYKHLD